MGWKPIGISNKLSKLVIPRMMFPKSPQIARRMEIQVPMRKLSSCVFHMLAAPFSKKEGATNVAEDLIKLICQPRIRINDDGWVLATGGT